MDRTHSAGRRWIVGIILGTLLVALGWIASRTIGTSLPGAGSAEVRFARMMEAHHQQAVDMALTLYTRSTDENLRIVALDIILTQQTQMGQMQGWLAVWGQPLAGPVEPQSTSSMPGHAMTGDAAMPGMATQEQVNALSTLPLGDAERSMLELMIRHHQGGVTMAQEILGETDRPEVVHLAQAIVTSQQSEIQTLQAMLAARQ